MNEFQAAMGLCNLRRGDAEIEKYFPVLFDGFKLSRDEVAKVLSTKIYSPENTSTL